MEIVGVAHPDQRKLLPLVPTRQSITQFPHSAKPQAISALWDHMRFVAGVAFWSTLCYSVNLVGMSVALGLGPEALDALGALPKSSMVKYDSGAYISF